MYKIVAFSNKNGKIVQYLPTDKSLDYFNKEYTASIWKDNLDSYVLAMMIADILTAYLNCSSN